MKQFRALLPTVLLLCSWVVLAVLLYIRLKLSLVRYFDADELAYLHWAHNVFSGVLPYRDFLLYVPPGFLYVLAPMYLFFHGAEVLTAARGIAFCIFVAMTGGVSLLFWRVRKSWTAVLAGIILVFLPLPADKLLELRPDNLATLIALVGLIYHIQGLEGSKRYLSWMAAGFWYSVSLLILPKTVPQIAVSSLVTFMWAVFSQAPAKDRVQSIIRFAAGGITPVLAFLVWIIVLSGGGKLIDTIIYSLTKLPFEVNRIGELFGMQADLFFYPNATYYGVAGWAIGLVANHIVWFIGLMVGCIRLVLPFLPHGRKGVWAEVLIAGSLFAHVASFMYGYPLRHAQYLIPIAVFIAFYAADGMDMLWRLFSRVRNGTPAYVLGYVFLIYAVFNVSNLVNSPKFLLTNREDIAVLESALTAIPKGAYVLDLVGSTIYFKDPYYVCCVPFGQWEPYLSRPLPDLSDRLELTETRYVYQGRLGRLATLSQADQAFIRASFTPYLPYSGFFVRAK